MTLSIDLLAQAVVSGVLIGGVFALISVGLTLIWGVMRIINFAHGEFLMIGMYVAFFLVADLHLDPYLTALATVPALFIFGAAVFRFTIQPILSHPSMNQIMLTLGLSLILQNLALVIFKADVLTVQTAYSRLTFNFDPVIVRVPQLIAFVGSGLAAVALYWFLQNTDTGRAIRAASQNSSAAVLMGIDVQRTFLLAFGIGSACLGVAASLMIPFYYTSPTVGLFFGLIAFVVVVLGGMGNFLGALAAGLIIGMTETVGAAIMPGSLSRVFTFAVFILVLLFRPQGIFGGKRQ
ncbi:MAG: branched-chain amino acid ABC transporter permease [Chloroflexota bacterium]